MTLPLLLLVLCCLAAGVALGWLLADRRTATATATLAAERSLIDARLAGLSAQALAPLEQTLAAMDAQLRQVEGERTAAYSGLRSQVAEAQRSSDGLRAETSALVAALRTPQVRGRWGETQLRRVLELAGALEHCDFVAQASVRDVQGDGMLRPDVVVQLAGGGTVVIDSKVPLAAHLEALEARDEATRREREVAHARQLRTHVNQLAAKAYWQQFDQAPEFVVLFVPSDAVLEAALRADPSLQEHAFGSDVVLATPSTLVALIRTVAHTWRGERLARDARQISELGQELHHRLSGLGDHVVFLGRSLDAAVGAYNKAVGCLESRVLVSARRFTDLGVTRELIPEPTPILTSTRHPCAPELASPSRAAASPQ